MHLQLIKAGKAYKHNKHYLSLSLPTSEIQKSRYDEYVGDNDSYPHYEYDSRLRERCQLEHDLGFFIPEGYHSRGIFDTQHDPR